MSEFKVGQKVEYTKPTIEDKGGAVSSRVPLGTKGVVTESTDKSSLVKWDNGHHFLHLNSYLKPYGNEMLRDLYMKGQRVRYIGPHGALTGCHGEVIGPGITQDNRQVRWDNGSLTTDINMAFLLRAVRTHPAAKASPLVTPKDDVKAPSHYQLFDGTESIEVIARAMTVAEFRGFCFGNVLKYRLRAGKKSELATMQKDLDKAAFYAELFEKHKGKCHADS